MINKSNIKRGIIIISLLVIISLAVINYCKHNFTGTVIDKKIEEIPGEWIVWRNYEIQVNSWFGEDYYLIENEDIYEKVEIGKEYSFKKSIFTRYVELK